MALALCVASQWPAAEGAVAPTPCARPAPLAASELGHTRRVSCGGGSGEIRGPARVLYGLGIDPNRADAATLEVLPGVGPARAAAIVAGRRQGAYRGPDDLRRVRGIGPVTVRRAKAWLSFPGPPMDAAGRR